jgi:hypothetical protein
VLSILQRWAKIANKQAASCLRQFRSDSPKGPSPEGSM